MSHHRIALHASNAPRRALLTQYRAGYVDGRDHAAAALPEWRNARVVRLDDYRRTVAPASARCRSRLTLRAWLHDHKIGLVERARGAGYVAGYVDGVSAHPDSPRDGAAS